MDKRKDWQPDGWTTWYDETYTCIKKLLINKFGRRKARGETPDIPQIFFRIDIKDAFENQLNNHPVGKKTITSGYTNALNDIINKREVERIKECRGKYKVVCESKLYNEIVTEIRKQ